LILIIFLFTFRSYIFSVLNSISSFIALITTTLSFLFPLFISFTPSPHLFLEFHLSVVINCVLPVVYNRKMSSL